MATWQEKLERLCRESTEAMTKARTPDEIEAAERLALAFYNAVSEYRAAGMPGLNKEPPPRMEHN